MKSAAFLLELGKVVGPFWMRNYTLVLDPEGRWEIEAVGYAHGVGGAGGVETWEEHRDRPFPIGLGLVGACFLRRDSSRENVSGSH